MGVIFFRQKTKLTYYTIYTIMALKYKAILYEERGREDEYLYLPEHKRRELTQPRPIDSILLDARCFTTAETYFFNKRGWTKLPSYFIEIEENPRMIEA